jgi:peptidoglycan/xylan/chitin deacetylase (PgdA/CDA1 family)
MFYFVKTPWWLKKLYGDCIWEIPGNEKIIYLSFDDGPHPVATPFVLDLLAQYHASATFFCIGKNVLAEPDLYQRILTEGHATGNHSFNHLNGWKTPTANYLHNIAMAQQYIDSNLFRPPYGRATHAQLKLLSKEPYRLKPVMWTVLSGDFDPALSNEKCLQQVLEHTRKGAIVVFHDSEKAYEKLVFTLPRMLEYFSNKGYRFEKITAFN